jgi:hypothetical protein
MRVQVIRKINHGLRCMVLAALVLSGCVGMQRGDWPQGLAGIPAQREIASVPFFPQDEYQCGPAALAMVLAWSGLNVEPAELTEKVYTASLKGSLQSVHSQGDQLAREKLRQGRGHRLEKRPRLDELDVGFDGVTRGGQNPLPSDGLFARKARRLDQPQPFLDTAGSRAVAVVVNNPLAPGAAEFRIVAARENQCVLDWDVALIGEAIQRPSLKLPAGELPLVHELMKRMLMVIALLADDMESRNELRVR